MAAYFGAHLVDRVPILCTVLGMFVSPFVPSPLPLVMGTNSLADEARAMRDGPVWTIEPPIDTDADHPSVDGSAFRRRHHVLPDELLVVTVSRLAIDLKLDALVHAIDAVDRLADRYPVRLVVIGDGEARDALVARATDVNRRRGRGLIKLAGAEPDPREGSTRPPTSCWVWGARRYVRWQWVSRSWYKVNEASRGSFNRPRCRSFCARASGESAIVIRGRMPSRSLLVPLLESPALRGVLGVFGRQTVEERFSLVRATETLLHLYDIVVQQQVHRHQVHAVGVDAQSARSTTNWQAPREHASALAEAAR